MIINDKFEFRLLKSGVIIAVDLSFEIEKLDKGADLNELMEISNDIYLDFSSLSYPAHLKKYFVCGLLWVKDNLTTKDSIIIRINGVEEYLPDFHEESLFFCISDWAAEYFQFDRKEYSFIKDFNLNRLVFDPDPLVLFPELNK